MKDIGSMTDAELVEAVAVKYDIKYYDIDRSSELWVWAVLDNFEEWCIEKSNDEYFCVLNDDIDNAVISTSFSRAVLEAALKIEYQERAIKNIRASNYIDAANLCLLADRAKNRR